MHLFNISSSTMESKIYEDIWCSAQKVSVFKRAKLMAYTLNQMRKVANTDYINARINAQNLANNIFKTLCSMNIPVITRGRDEKKMKESMLFLSNHQAFGLEALCAYGLVPVDTRIIMKANLTQIKFPPSIGRGYAALDPVVFNRSAQNKRERIEAIKCVLQEVCKTAQNGQRLMFFPEHSRSKDGYVQKFPRINERIIKEYIKSTSKLTQNTDATIITCDTYSAMPLSASQLLTRPIYKLSIQFHYDYIPLEELNMDRVRSIMQSRLRALLEQQIKKNSSV